MTLRKVSVDARACTDDALAGAFPNSRIAENDAKRRPCFLQLVETYDFY